MDADYISFNNLHSYFLGHCSDCWYPRFLGQHEGTPRTCQPQSKVLRTPH
jgi:hypothetical protein